MASALPPPTRSSGRSLRHALTSRMIVFAVLPAFAGGLLIALWGGWLIQAQVFARMQSIADGACTKLELICSDLPHDLDRFAQRQEFRYAAAVLTDPSAPVAERRAQQHIVGDQLGQLVSPTAHLGGAAVIVSL
ncbi:MAG: hypothetical protein KKI08_06835, partial [Armatimonadetes bacterium]|nr:hypothetical protein [Armatimonadota bacterium]